MGVASQLSSIFFLIRSTRALSFRSSSIWFAIWLCLIAIPDPEIPKCRPKATLGFSRHFPAKINRHVPGEIPLFPFLIDVFQARSQYSEIASIKIIGRWSGLSGF